MFSRCAVSGLMGVFTVGALGLALEDFFPARPGLEGNIYLSLVFGLLVGILHELKKDV